MDRLRKLLAYLSTQVGSLSVSQQLALAMSAALIVVSMLWLLQWSGRPDLVPLATYDFSFEELDEVETAIQGTGLPYEIRGTHIFVRARDKHNLLRVVSSADALPEGSLYDMAMVVSDPNPFEDPSSRRFKQNFAKGNELAKIIATSPAVKKAAVMINPSEKRRPGGGSHVPKASVTVTLSGGRDMSPAMVQGFASLVANAVAGLKPYNVAIIDSRTMRSYSVPHPDDPGSVDSLGLAKQREAHFEDKIRNKLSHIPGVQAAVTVELENSKSIKQKQVYAKPIVKSEKTQSSEQSDGSAPTEPGAQANLGQAVTAASGRSKSTTEETNTENFPANLSETETIEKFPFSTKHVTAAVGIPRSFLVGVFRAQHPEVTDPPKDDDPLFTALRDEQIGLVRNSVERIIMAKASDDVQVDVYPDMEWTSEGGGFAAAPGSFAASGGSTATMDPLAMLEQYGPQAGLGVLALLSLMMMSRLVRKSSDDLAGKPPSSFDDGESDEELVFGASGPVGEATATSGFLVGREVTDDVLRAEELSREVAKMVDEDPDSAADLVTRWINDGG